MELEFDSRGNLKPYGRNEITLDELETKFVIPFNEDSSRQIIFENLKRYIDDFKAEITPNFKQWINGSYVTNKLDPNDIDIVNLVDYKIVTKLEKKIRQNFLNKKSLKVYRIDAYIVKIYPQGHKEYGKTLSDLLYWEHWFSNTKINRAKKRFGKGFVELSF